MGLEIHGNLWKLLKIQYIYKDLRFSNLHHQYSHLIIMVRHRGNTSKLHKKRHFSRAVANSSKWEGQTRLPKSNLQRSLQVSGKLFVRNKELEKEKVGLQEFGVVEMSTKLEQEEQLQQQQQHVQELQQQVLQLQQQLQQEKDEKEEALREKEKYSKTAWNQLMRAEQYKRECSRLEGEVRRIQG
jgi:Mg-chelatase subunit ChlI